MNAALALPTAQLAPCAPARRLTRDALYAALALAAAFWLFAELSTQVHSIRAQSPWQDDPYDVVVSFTGILVLLVAGLAVLRVPLCRAEEPLPGARLLALQRCAEVIVVLVAATVLTDWAAVGAGAHSADAGANTERLTAGLAGLTLLAAAAAVLVLRSRWAIAATAVDSDMGPDWGDDLLALADQAGRIVAPAAGLLALAKRVLVASLDGRWGLRRHRLAFALAAAGAFGFGLAGSNVLVEGSLQLSLDALGIFLLLATIGTAGMFALLASTGRYLRLLHSPEGDRGAARPAEVAAVAAAAAVLPAVAFREAIAGLLFSASGDEPLVLVAMLAVAAGLSAAVAYAVASRLRSHG